MTASNDLAIDFNPHETLGFLVTDWIEQHCKVPSGVYEGEGLAFNGWQLYCTLNHYRIRPKARPDSKRLVAPFTYRRSVVVGPQKCGKSPWGAGITLNEAVGPSLFDGWAEEGDIYRCSDHGCGCGWEYEYLLGEAKGIPRKKSLVGLLAFTEDQVDNVYEPLQTMIHSGPLGDYLRVREGFIRLPNRGMIIPLSSAAKSKLGKPLTAALADESGLYTKTNKVLDTWQTMRRGVAGMQGRTLELTNAWDPIENSAAQQAFESSRADIFHYYKAPPAELKYQRKRDRHKIHALVYADSPWVDPATIDAEAAELVETDPHQAERFFGNRLVQGLGSFLTDELWDDGEFDQVVPGGAAVCGGFDGSRSGDWTAIRLETLGGHRFTPTYGPDNRPAYWDPKDWPGEQIPRGEVTAAMDEIFRRYKVARFYVDPRHWETQADAWASAHGEDVVVQWPTNALQRMFDALTRFREDLEALLTTHSADGEARLHALRARKVAKPGDRFLLGKPAEHMKIDILMADVLAHEAASDMRASGWLEVEKGSQILVWAS